MKKAIKIVSRCKDCAELEFVYLQKGDYQCQRTGKYLNGRELDIVQRDCPLPEANKRKRGMEET